MNNTSFRDPAGCVFKLNNIFYRKINKCYKEDYEHFISSGLYNELVKLDLLLSHEEIEQTADVALCKDANFYKLIKPTQINYISYPYEWCFSALKDAALLTLKIQKISLRYSMILKDASAYNIQFLGFNLFLLIHCLFKNIMKVCLGMDINNFVRIFWLRWL